MLPPFEELERRDLSTLPTRRGASHPNHTSDYLYLDLPYARTCGISFIGNRQTQCDALALGPRCVLVSDGMGDSQKGGRLIAALVTELLGTLLNVGWDLETAEEEIASILADLTKLEATGVGAERKRYVLNDCYISKLQNGTKMRRFSADLYKVILQCWENGDYGFASKVPGELTDLTLAYLRFRKPGRSHRIMIEVWGDTRIDHFPARGKPVFYGSYFDLDPNLDFNDFWYQAREWFLNNLTFAQERRIDLMEIQSEEAQSQEELMESSLAIDWIEPQIERMKQHCLAIEKTQKRSDIWELIDEALNFPVVAKQRFATTPTGFLNGRKQDDEWIRVPDIAEELDVRRGDIITLKTDGYSKLISPYLEEKCIWAIRKNPDKFAGNTLCEKIAAGLYDLIRQISSRKDFFKGRMENTAFLVMEIKS